MKYLFTICLFFFLNQIVAQVGIGTTIPNNDAALDITSTNQGVLLTRVALANSTLANPLTNHVAGMMVYNTATSGDVTPGMYYNDGTKWIKMTSPTYRQHFVQTSSLSITGNATYFAVPGLDGTNITVPTTGYYQFDFIGYYATPMAEGGFFEGTYFCNGEGFFRIRINGNTNACYTYSTSITEETAFGSDSFYDLSNNAKSTFQVHLPAGTHTINVDFYQYSLGNDCQFGTNSTVGGLYGGTDNCSLSVFYVGQ